MDTAVVSQKASSPELPSALNQAKPAVSAEDEEDEEPPKLKRGPWSAEEDQRLLELVQQNRSLRWVKIAKLLGTRTSKQCRERYHQNLKPSLNHRPITEEEGKEITRLVGIYGKRWAAIARHLQGRSDNTIKNWWNAGANRRRLELNSQLAAPPGNGVPRNTDPTSTQNNEQLSQPQVLQQQHQQQHQQQQQKQQQQQNQQQQQQQQQLPQQQYLQPHPAGVTPMYPVQVNYGYNPGPGYPYYQVPGQSSSGFIPGSQFYQMSQQQRQQQYVLAAGQYFNPENMVRQQAGAGPIYMTMSGYPSQLMMPLQPQATQVQMPAGIQNQAKTQTGTSPVQMPQLIQAPNTPHTTQTHIQPAVQPQAAQAPQTAQVPQVPQAPQAPQPPQAAQAAQAAQTSQPLPTSQTPKSELSPGTQRFQSSPGRRLSDALSPTQVLPEQKTFESAIGTEAQPKQPLGSLFKASYAEPAHEHEIKHQSPAGTATKLAQTLPSPMCFMGPSHVVRHRLSVDHSPYRRNSLEELSRRSVEFSSRPSTPDSRRSSLLHSSEFNQRKASTSWAPPDSSRRHSAAPETRQSSPLSGSALTAQHLDTPPPPAGSGKAPSLAPAFTASSVDPSDRSRRVSIANLMSE